MLLQPHNRIVNIKSLLHVTLFCHIKYFVCFYENIYDHSSQRMALFCHIKYFVCLNENIYDHSCQRMERTINLFI